MSSLNEGNQTLTFDYKNQATGALFNTLLRDLLKPGVSKIATAITNTGNVITIPAMTIGFNVGTNKFIHITTTENVLKTAIMANGDMLVATFTYAESIDTFIDWTWRPSGGSAITNEVILCQVTYDGGGNVTAIDNSVQTKGLYDNTTGIAIVDTSMSIGKTTPPVKTVDIAGTLDVTDAVTFGSTLSIIGNIISAINIIGNFAINTNKFTVDSATGNTLVAGTLDVTNDLKVNTDKVTIDSATGDTFIAGTLGVTGIVTLDDDLNVAGNLDVAGSGITGSGNLTMSGIVTAPEIITTGIYTTATGYTSLDDDKYGTIIYSGTSGDQTHDLPTLADNQGREITIINDDATPDTITVDGEGSEAIDDMTTIDLAKQGDFITVKALPTKWKIINEKISCQLNLNTHAGYGSSDTRIVKFTNVVDDYGNMFSHNHGSYGTAGLDITINKSGKFSFTYISSAPNLERGRFGLTLNVSSRNTNLGVQDVAEIIGYGSIESLSGGAVPTTQVQTVTWSGFLNKNDVIRPHTNGYTVDTSIKSQFMVSYLGN